MSERVDTARERHALEEARALLAWYRALVEAAERRAHADLALWRRRLAQVEAELAEMEREA